MSGYYTNMGWHYGDTNSSSSGGSSTAFSLDQLTDTVLSGATDKQVLTYNGSNWVNKDIEYACQAAGYTGSIQIGLNSTLTPYDDVLSLVIGCSGIAGGVDSCALGHKARATGDYSLSVGNNTVASGLNSVAVFGSATASNAISLSSSCSGANSISIGGNCTGSNSCQIGENSNLTNDSSVQMGYGSNLKGAQGVMIGASNGNASGASGAFNVILGSGNFTHASNTAGKAVVIGTNCVQGAASVDNLIAIGENACQSQTDGLDNIGIGKDAAKSVTSGYKNIVLGNSSLTNQVFPSENIVIGHSCAPNLSGYQNCIMSYQCGITGNCNENVILGPQCVTSGKTNKSVIIGAQSGYVCNSDEATYIGYQSGYNSGISKRSSYIGYLTAPSLVGDDNTCLGNRCLTTSGTSGIYQLTAIGSGAMAAGNLTNACQGSVAVGFNALNALVSGKNVAIGANSQKLISTGTGNTSCGIGTMDAAASGVNYCVAIGQDALGGSLTTGANNTVGIGYQALMALTSGGGNVAVGYQNQLLITTGNSNTTLGSGVMDAAGTGVSECVGIGTNALGAAMTTGANATVAIGVNALNSLTSGAGNVGCGYFNQRTITTGTGNATFGYNVMGNASTNAGVSYCVGFGSSALAGALTTGANGTVSVGYQALNALTSGVNCAIGFRSQELITTGTQNTTLGYATMDAAAVGVSYCTAVGHNALGGSLTTGANGSSCFGVNSGLVNTSGVICAFGHNSLPTNSTGTYNAGFGNYSLYSLSTGGYNTSVGIESGSTVETGSYNTFLGAYARADTVGRSGCVVIGANAIPTADDQLVFRMGNTSTKELIITPVTDATARSDANTYLPIKIGSTQYYLKLYT